MTEKYTKARFWKCALQVNPYSYISYRGKEQVMSEDEYNQALLKVCLEEKIKVIGIADHGNVDGIDKIKEVMKQNDILVFPGFEIASSEKIHFVCLFAENTSKDELNRYLGNLELLDTENGVRPSTLSAEQIFSKIADMNGFIYAAHCTNDGGLLKAKMAHIWKNELLKAVQIPCDIEELKGVADDFYRKVILNRNNDYHRENPMAVINAKDVEKPETLADRGASCLIKMTKPSFASFKLAFQDPRSRVRLNSEVMEKYYSRIESVRVTGGYLDGLNVEFSEHLNAVIGGRGTGKSTLLECIRYALELEPIGENAQKQHLEIIKENIGKLKARVELIVRSSKMNGKKYTIARRYGESASIKDEAGNISSFTPGDILPAIEIYGQNEIYEIAQDGQAQRKLLTRFLESGHNESEEKIEEVLDKLAKNREKLYLAQDGIVSLEEELSRLPQLEERIRQFKELGVGDKLKIVPLLETEKRLKKRVIEEELRGVEQFSAQLKDVLPDTLFLSEKVLEKLPHADLLKRIKEELDGLKRETEQLVSQWEISFTARKRKIDHLTETLQKNIAGEENNLEQTFRDLPGSEGKSGREIGIEYQQLLRDIEKIRPQQISIKTRQQFIDELKKERRNLLSELSKFRSERSSRLERSLKKLNKQLIGKLKLTVKPEADRTPVIKFLLSCDLENVGRARLGWINETDDFSPVRLAELIEQDSSALTECNWNIIPTVASALGKMRSSDVLKLQELELHDNIEIELNVSHIGTENYRLLGKLSTGQQCTAILHLLLLQNKDPLIMDQPEDNLDNAFIADRIVAELRNAKINRQFIFATHNANIPVFGDAEWIGVFESSDNHAEMPEKYQGGIDIERVREMAANILEGGRPAFNQRKIKYGY